MRCKIFKKFESFAKGLALICFRLLGSLWIYSFMLFNRFSCKTNVRWFNFWNVLICLASCEYKILRILTAWAASPLPDGLTLNSFGLLGLEWIYSFTLIDPPTNFHTCIYSQPDNHARVQPSWYTNIIRWQHYPANCMSSIATVMFKPQRFQTCCTRYYSKENLSFFLFSYAFYYMWYCR